MAKHRHLELLKEGVKLWNDWRAENPDVEPDLSNSDLKRSDLEGADLRNSNLIGANLRGASLVGANLEQATLIRTQAVLADFTDANLMNARISYAVFREADFTRANLTNANSVGADFRGANLMYANLNKTHLPGADLTSAELEDADFSNADIGRTIFGSNDLTKVKGLETVFHRRPSIVGIDTLYLSAARIPQQFLQGCGIPDEFITYLPSLIGAKQAVQFYSCFISYSNKDEEFSKRLYSRLRDEHIRVWFAPEDMQGGKKLYEQIERAIEVQDRLLLVLSETSMYSEWVITEIRNARRVEVQEKRRKLFPIRLVDFDTIRGWKCLDPDTGKDLAVEVREYFIPEFSNWKDQDSFEKAFKRLLRDLRYEETNESRT